MENRKPFQLKHTLVVYNLFQVLFSTWLFYEVSTFYFLPDSFLHHYMFIQKRNNNITINWLNFSNKNEISLSTARHSYISIHRNDTQIINNCKTISYYFFFCFHSTRLMLSVEHKPDFSVIHSIIQNSIFLSSNINSCVNYFFYFSSPFSTNTHRLN